MQGFEFCYKLQMAAWFLVLEGGTATLYRGGERELPMQQLEDEVPPYSEG